MENFLLWGLNVLIGLLVAFGGVILHNIRDDIREVVGNMKNLECKVERHKERLDLVVVPNVGIAMCNKIQEGQRATLDHLGTTCERADTRSRENREALIRLQERFEGKLDAILSRFDQLHSQSE